MKRVDLARADRPPGRHERLGRHLATEDPLNLLDRLDPPEEVDLDRLEIEQVDQLVEGFAHRDMLAADHHGCAPFPQLTLR